MLGIFELQTYNGIKEEWGSVDIDCLDPVFLITRLVTIYLHNPADYGIIPRELNVTWYNIHVTYFQSKNYEWNDIFWFFYFALIGFE